METLIQPLVKLAARPTPAENTGFKIKINKKLEDEGDKEKPKMNIIDRRNKGNVDRKRILENLKRPVGIKNELIVPEENQYREEKGPKITSRKIVIPNDNFEEVKEPEPEEAEEEKEEEIDEIVKPLKKTKQIEEIKEPEEKEEAREETKEPEEEKEEPEDETKEPEEEKEEPEDETDEPEEEMESIQAQEELEESEDSINRVAQELEKDESIEPEKSNEKDKYMLGDENIKPRLPGEREKIIVKAPTYYMHNRRIFLQKLNNLFLPFKDEIKDNKTIASCDLTGSSSRFDLLTHQKVVRDYLNLYTPYRGLLIYHGLGSGKTCTSIAMAEGMKSNKRVFVMTPASLKMNFFSEMKKCGDELYKKNQYWEFVSIEGSPEYVKVLSRALNLSPDFIEKKKGAWLVNINKESNFTELNTTDQLAIDTQLNEMIRSKYFDINYNGLNQARLDLITGNGSRNPFDNSVVLIDEAHNFVSRIVNKLTVKAKDKKPLSIQLYNYLLNAENAKIILLSGTPLINYPNELGVMYNILRGNITSYSIPLKRSREGKVNKEYIMQLLDKNNMKNFDYVEYSNNILEITRNPFGFINTKKRGALKGQTKKKGGKKKRKTEKKYPIAEPILYQKENLEEMFDDVEERDLQPYTGGAGEVMERYNGVKLDEAGNITNQEFIDNVVKILKKDKLDIDEKNIIPNKYQCLPDKTDDFINDFINVETAQLKNINTFKKRILGLTSYFRSAQEGLLPTLIKTEKDEPYFIEEVEFSPYQFSVYEKMRKLEADKTEKINKAKRMKRGNDDTQDIFGVASTYRVFSRAYCNYVFPYEVKDLVKQDIDQEELEEDVFDEYFNKPEFVKKALEVINKERDGEKEYLVKEKLLETSPKMLRMLQNIQSPENDGLHLMYSHFRTVYGVGVFRLILLANGFSEFKIRKSGSTYVLDEEELDNKPKFVLYTGTETAEEKEIIRNAYNGNWDYIPLEIAEKLRKVASNNNNGEIIKLMMITASGAEGINLKNTRFVHIMEPYWHNVRLEQVVGRARRICSHQDLPEEKRNVKVFLYMTVLSQSQKTDKNNVELMIRDVSKLDKKTVFSTDQTLFEIANIKQKINQQLLTSIKESAIDCSLYKEGHKEESLVCYGYGKVESNQFSSYPNLQEDMVNKEQNEVKKINWTPIIVTINKIDYALNEETRELYDYESYQANLQNNGEMLLVGKLIGQDGKYRIKKV